MRLSIKILFLALILIFVAGVGTAFADTAPAQYGIRFCMLPPGDTFDSPFPAYITYLPDGGGNCTKMDTFAYIDKASGRTMIPVRYLANALGAQTSWDAATQTVTITKGSTTIVMVVDSTTLTVNGVASQMETAPVIKALESEGYVQPPRTFLPARYVAEALGAQVQYDSYMSAMDISVGGYAFPPDPK